ncbi:unnamed protein product [Lymnaea stagnalis]|uniref:Glycerate kinase n=1 Tax=Lymnaea stagnalis TaxID=6523 RepID=A0AAV2IMY4_LYMST
MSFFKYIQVIGSKRLSVAPQLFRVFSNSLKNCMQTSCGIQSFLPELRSSSTCRSFSISAPRNYEVAVNHNPKDHGSESDLKQEAVDIFKTAIRAVRPKVMIEKVLQYNRITSTLNVEEKSYKINRNVFVVGFGEAVLGMARAVEDVLGDNLVNGIVSIPQGMQEEMKSNELAREMFLSPTSKIQVFEGTSKLAGDEPSHSAAKAIQSLISNLSETDLLIVVLSEGGTMLCPSPYPQITLEELFQVNQLLTRNGASKRELNIVCKNIEVLKGGGLAKHAEPAKVVSLILSSVIGDAVDLIASGPTYPNQPTPHHCVEILMRLHIWDKTPESIRKFLEKEIKQLNMEQNLTGHKSAQKKAQQDKILSNVQNVIVGNNSIACEAASNRAAELGYLPLVLTTELTGEAKALGYLYLKLAKFIMFCYDRRASWEPNPELTMLELELVASGIKKKWINYIANSVDKAHNMNKDICIIAGGDTVVHVSGSGQGGKCMESALAAAIQMHEEFREKKLNVSESDMCFLMGDSDGHDGVTKMAGAIIDQEFLDKVQESGLDMKKYLSNNDSFTFFNNVNNGKNLICTNLTGTDIMNMLVILVRQPKDVKYQYSTS